MSRIPVVSAALAALALFGCGYHMAGTTNMLPASVHTVAIPPFTNATTHTDLGRYLTEALSREVIARTRYAVIADGAQADAVLQCGIANVFAYATTIDAATGRPTGSQVILQLQIRLVDKSGKVLYNRPNLEVKDRYEVSTLPNQYFDESQSAYQRLSRNAARAIVSGILENF